jgi:hypothetical protein
VRAILLAGLLLCVGLTGCSTISDWWTDRGEDVVPVVPPITPPVVPPVTPPTDAKLWSSYYAPRWMGHGYPSENDDRLNAIKAARLDGKDCLRVDGRKQIDAFYVDVLPMKSPKDGKRKKGQNNFHERAQAAGITRWQIIVPDGLLAHWKRVLSYCDEYDRTTLQLIVPAAMLSQARETWPGFDVFAEQ